MSSEVFKFIMTFSPGIVVWCVTYYLIDRKFHNWVTIFEIIIYSKICSIIVSIIKFIYNIETIISWTPYTFTCSLLQKIPYKSEIVSFIIALILGFIVTILIKKELFLKFARKTKITQKTIISDPWVMIHDQAKSSYCYIHTKDNTVIHGYVKRYCPDNRSFSVYDPHYIKYKGEENKRIWAIDENFVREIYFNDFSNIDFIEFEMNAKEYKEKINELKKSE